MYTPVFEAGPNVIVLAVALTLVIGTKTTTNAAMIANNFFASLLIFFIYNLPLTKCGYIIT